MAGPGPRRQAREAALQVLFAADVGAELDPESVATAFDDVLREFSLPQRARDRAIEVVRGVAENRKTIDEAISARSTHWKVARLATVDRNILRVATWELLFDPRIPTEVVIDEAVEIARRFGGSASPAFVNGVLDQIAQCATPGTEAAAREGSGEQEGEGSP
ncbi:MAG: transcription antitermination factor NusB [Deltaproteobacteria bacterium]|nr:transcription antitermination factor NusB [Deltaproteobacteria bacterium]MBW2414230.1 transcription antitermination factor NusB [Deltaproteobacteria bacterium]